MPSPFRKGTEFWVVRATPAPPALPENSRQVYLGGVPDWRVVDRFPEEMLRCAHHFFNVQTGVCTEWLVEGDEARQAATMEIFLQYNGGWPRSKAGEVQPLPKDAFNLALGPELLRDHLAYFKSVAEGAEGIENIYVWLDRHDAMLTSLLSGGERLAFRQKPFAHIEAWLAHFSMPCQPSCRYAWLDRIVHSRTG